MRVAESAAASPPRTSLAAWRRGSPAAWGALAVVAVEGLVALTFEPQRLLALVVLVLAPGLALTPFLPRELAVPAVRVAVVPILGAAASSVTLISAAAFGIPLTGLSVRLIVLFVVLAGGAASVVFAAGLRRDLPDARIR